MSAVFPCPVAAIATTDCAPSRAGTCSLHHSNDQILAKGDVASSLGCAWKNKFVAGPDEEELSLALSKPVKDFPFDIDAIYRILGELRDSGEAARYHGPA